MSDVIEEILRLFATCGSRCYGESLSLGDHMLQTASLAQARAAPPSLVVAGLLHDVGHFLHPEGESPGGGARDAEHAALGAAWLSQAFGEEVTAPVALHIEAKRYLCAVESAYFARLSEASRISLEAQGGPMNAAETATFAARPHARDAIFLRRCDDEGKDHGTKTLELDDFRDLLRGRLLRA